MSYCAWFFIKANAKQDFKFCYQSLWFHGIKISQYEANEGET